MRDPSGRPPKHLTQETFRTQMYLIEMRRSSLKHISTGHVTLHSTKSAALEATVPPKHLPLDYLVSPQRYERRAFALSTSRWAARSVMRDEPPL